MEALVHCGQGMIELSSGRQGKTGISSGRQGKTGICSGRQGKTGISSGRQGKTGRKIQPEVWQLAQGVGSQ